MAVRRPILRGRRSSVWSPACSERTPDVSQESSSRAGRAALPGVVASTQPKPEPTPTSDTPLKHLLACVAVWSALVAAPGLARAAPELEELVVEPASLDLGPGEEVELTVTGVYDDDSTADLTEAVVFESSKPQVVTVVDGRAIAGRSGDTKIRVRHAATNVRVDVEVTVREIVALTIDPTTETIEVGDSVQLTAFAELDDGRTGFDVTDIVEWEADPGDVASVEGGLVTGLEAGVAEIQVTDPDSGTDSEPDAAVITVVNAPDPNAELLEITAAPVDILTFPGGTAQLTVTGRYDDDTFRDVTSQVTYSSNRPQFATVDTAGLVTAHAPGTARISIQHPSGRSVGDRPEVTVGGLTQIHLSPVSAEVAIGATTPMLALGTFDNGVGADITAQVEWSSTVASVASVSNLEGTRGLVTGVAAGVARISAMHVDTGIASPISEGDVTVVAPAPTPGPSPTPGSSEIRDLVFDPPVLRLQPGESDSFTVTAIHRDGSTTDVTDRVLLRVVDRRVATAAAGGEITAGGGGQTQVRARDPISGKRSRAPGRIEVRQLLRLTVSPPSVSLSLGQQMQLTALADYDDGSTGVDITANVDWSVEHGSIAGVNDGSHKGRVTGIADGRTIVHVEEPVSGIRSDRATGRIAVGTPPALDPDEVVGLVLDPERLVVPLREERSVSITALLVGGGTVPLATSDVAFRPASRRIAIVGGNGAVFGRRAGATFIEVEHRASGVTGRLPVLVRAVSRLTVDPSSNVVEVGQAIELGAEATWNDGSGPSDVITDVRWRSRDPGLAQVDRDVPGRVIGRSEGIAIIEVSDPASGVRSNARSGVVHVVTGLVSISVEPRAVALTVGEDQQFQALGHYSDGSVADLSDEVEWAVAGSSVASIDSSGHLTAIAAGQTFVSATDPETGIASQGFDRAVVAVGRTLVGLQVSPSPDLEDDPRTMTLAAGQTERLYGLALLETGGATDRSTSVAWTSTNPTTVHVSQEGLASCLAVGSAVISIRDPATSLTSTASLGDTTVECSAARVERLEVRPAESNLDFPAGRNLRAFRIYTDGHEVEVTTQVQWSVSDPSALSVVATGAEAGRVTSIADGIVTVTANDAGFLKSATGMVTVRKVRVDLRIFELDPLPDKNGVFHLSLQGILKLRARVEYLSGATRGVNNLVQWTSSNTSVLQMGAAAGLQSNWGRALAPGTTTITARWPADEHSPELTDSVQVVVE